MMGLGLLAEAAYVACERSQRGLVSRLDSPRLREIQLEGCNPLRGLVSRLDSLRLREMQLEGCDPPGVGRIVIIIIIIIFFFFEEESSSSSS
ncbi:hypothetical protein ACLOJK_032820 [Asimina triloba]